MSKCPIGDKIKTIMTNKMRYKVGDKVKLTKPASFPNGITIPTDVELEITFKDPFFKTYDIIYENKQYTDFSDEDFV